MAPLTTPKLIQATFNATYVVGTPVVVFNQTTGEYLTTELNGDYIRISSSKKVVVAADRFASGWAAGQVIIFQVSGKYYGTGSVTLTAGTGIDKVATAIAAGSGTMSALNI